MTWTAKDAGHSHGEAFCLMWYRCDKCEHKESIWNSRDGVTPFSMSCPSCGELSLFHWRFDLDKYSPNYELLNGQRYWRDGTKEEAIELLHRRFDIFAGRGQPVPIEVKNSMLLDLEKPSSERREFQDGWPQLDIWHGPARLSDKINRGR